MEKMKKKDMKLLIILLVSIQKLKIQKEKLKNYNQMNIDF
jgi:hypothetical protein